MTRIPAIVLTATLALTTCGFAIAQGTNPHGSHSQAKSGDAASTKDYKNVHEKMMKAMVVKYSGNSDMDFVRGMIPHHQGAIDMAKVQLVHGKDEQIRKLAQQIIADQEKEIAQMQDWLKKNSK